MRVIKADAVNKEIILYLKAYPDGLSAKSLAEYTHFDYFVVYQRLLRLKTKGIITAKEKLWSLTNKGATWLSDAVKQPVRLSRYDQKESQNVKHISTLPPKRLNAMQVYFKPYDTEYIKIEALFAEGGIKEKPKDDKEWKEGQYIKEKVKNYTQYLLKYQGYILKFTTRKIIAYIPEEFTGFDIEGKVLTNRASDKACEAITRLTDELHIRMQEQNGKLWYRIAYFEIAHTQSDISKAVMKETRRVNTVPLAFDRMTAKSCTWADNSFKLNELEFNQLTVEQLNANIQQDLKDGKWNHRQEQQKLDLMHETLKKVIQVQESQITGASSQALLNQTLIQAISGIQAELQAVAFKPKPNRREWT